MHYYLLTIRKHQVKDYVTEETLNRHLKYYNVKDYCYEAHGKYKQLHVHAIVEIDTIDVKEHKVSHKGFLHHIKIINSKPHLLACIHYLYKHNPNQEYVNQTRLANYFRHHYAMGVQCPRSNTSPSTRIDNYM